MSLPNSIIYYQILANDVSLAKSLSQRNIDAVAEAIRDLATALKDERDTSRKYLAELNAKFISQMPPITEAMELAGRQAHYDAEQKIEEVDAYANGGFAHRKVRARHVYKAMVEAAFPDKAVADKPEAVTAVEATLREATAKHPAQLISLASGIYKAMLESGRVSCLDSAMISVAVGNAKLLILEASK